MDQRPATVQRPKRMLSVKHDVPADFAAFVRSGRFPCVGAKSALALGALAVLEGGDFCSPESDAEIHAALVRFGAEAPCGASAVASFACLFSPSPAMEERAFEAALWRRVQGLHDIDAASGFPWASGVAREPDSPEFSFCIGGAAYFVVGLHPGASRPARRFCRPALVFNSHEQFERLRQDGRYDTMQSIIRRREMALHGSINPMLSDFGRGRASAQYSGRKVEPDWTCPLRVKA